MKAKSLLTLSTVACIALGAAAQQGGPPPTNDSPQQQRRGGFVMVGPDGQKFQGVGGQITSISGDTIKLKTPDGQEATVKISSDTQFRRDRNPAKLQDFKVGEFVMVRGTPSGENQWNAQMIGTRSDAQQQLRGEMGKNFVAGEVKSLDPPKMTILRPDGVTQTIEADENTSLKKQNESITMADIQPGDHIFARGEVKNGSFVPAMIMVAPPGAMRFMMNGGGVERGQQQPADKSQKPESNPKQ
jgi:Domain of unknown function (DUF5666)